MQAFTPAIPVELNSLKPGEFFLLHVGNEFEPAFLVEHDGTRFVLILNFDTGSGRREFRLFRLVEFNGQAALHFQNARIVPSFTPGHLKPGRPGNFQDSKALYIRPQATVVYAQTKTSPKKVNLTTGTLYGESVEDGAHTTHWRIECPAPEGGHQILREFTA
ncbi:MAG: hypothetical protein PGN33_13290 [Methylobacterium radiotolerans]